MNKQRVKFLLMALAIILAGIALDQLTKWLSVAYLKPVGSVKLIPGVVSLTYVENRGAAFGMLAGQRWIFMVVSTLAILGMGGFLFTLKEKSETLLAVALSMIVSGGIGNMIDRIALGYVVDFIDVNPLLSHIHLSFAIFNGADSFVCVGAGILVLYYLLTWRKEEKAKKETEAK